MIVQHEWEKILSGQKTQMRRIAKPSHEFRGDYVIEVFSGRVIYQVGKTYAVQPSLKQKAVARVHIVDIRREDVRTISLPDAQAEGFDNTLDFLRLWVAMHDPAIALRFQSRIADARRLGDSQPAIDLLASRAPDRYAAFVLTFHLVTNHTTE